MNVAVFFSVLFVVFAFAMLFSGFWAREELSPEWRQAKAAGFVLIGVGGLLGVAGVLGKEVGATTGGIWLLVSVSGLAAYGRDLRPKDGDDGSPAAKLDASDRHKPEEQVQTTRWEGRIWAVWVPAIIALAVMAAGVAFAASR